MLMNGKEVNHLIISGEKYDKSYVGCKVRLVKDCVMRGYIDNSYRDHLVAEGNAGVMLAGSENTIIAVYKDWVSIYGGWVKKTDVELID